MEHHARRHNDEGHQATGGGRQADSPRSNSSYCLQMLSTFVARLFEVSGIRSKWVSR